MVPMSLFTVALIGIGAAAVASMFGGLALRAVIGYQERKRARHIEVFHGAMHP
jgi:hypothetical protein